MCPFQTRNSSTKVSSIERPTPADPGHSDYQTQVHMELIGHERSLKRLVVKREHFITPCSPFVEKMKCDRIATYYGKYEKPYYECRVKIAPHANYSGKPLVSDLLKLQSYQKIIDK